VTSGSQANRSGRTAEDAIADLLSRHHCEFSRQVEVGTSIYGTTMRADFLAHNLVDFPKGLVIESKWQDTAGTADEKFPYLAANVRGNNYRHPVVVVVYGGGFRPGAVRWLQEQVDGEHLIAVFSFEGLLSWLQRHVRVHVTSPKLPWTTRSNRA
jgi:hypothetical protein